MEAIQLTITHVLANSGEFVSFFSHFYPNVWKWQRGAFTYNGGKQTPGTHKLTRPDRLAKYPGGGQKARTFRP